MKYLIARNLRRVKLYNKTETKRLTLKSIITNQLLPKQPRILAMSELMILRKNLRSKIRNRCLITQRSRAFLRILKVSRIKLKEYSNWGLIPGIRKSSW